MRYLEKVISMVLIGIMCGIMLISCGVKSTPEESTYIYLNALLKADNSRIGNIGMKEDEFDKLRKDVGERLINFFVLSGIGSVSDETKNNFKDNVFQGISKVDYEVTLGSVDKDTAKVNVKLKVFDIDKITNYSQSKIKEEFTANPAISEKDILQEFFKIVGQAFADGTFKEESKTIEVTLNKKNDIWIQDDNAEGDILNAIVGR